MIFFFHLWMNFHYFHIILFVIHIYLYEGLKISPHSERFYRDAEAKSVTLVERMLKMFIFAETFLFIPPALLPMVYAIFHTPDRQFWQLPLDIKYCFIHRVLPQPPMNLTTVLNTLLCGHF